MEGFQNSGQDRTACRPFVGRCLSAIWIGCVFFLPVSARGLPCVILPMYCTVYYSTAVTVLGRLSPDSLERDGRPQVGTSHSGCCTRKRDNLASTRSVPES